MFERYSESARRVLFFARYEASELGVLVIETEHQAAPGREQAAALLTQVHLRLGQLRGCFGE
jgi:hypothetical protein